ncbi:UNVERIFIED_CONTAM: hypothetical protein FKN15_076035 [Acipenser sinensis]
MEKGLWCLHITEVRHYRREGPVQRGNEGPPLHRRMESYEGWLRDPSTPPVAKNRGTATWISSWTCREVQWKAITRRFPGLNEAVERMTQVVDWVYEERERELLPSAGPEWEDEEEHKLPALWA